VDFRYTVTDRIGKKIREIASADSISSLVANLKHQGLKPIKIESIAFAPRRKKKRSFFKRTSATPWEVAVLTRQLAATLASGLLLSEALDAVGGEMDNEYFGRVISKVRRDIHGGTNFSCALAKYPKIFSTSYVAIVRSGEAIGNLDKTLANLAKFLENAEQLKEKIKSAVTYPAFVFVFALLITSLLVLFLIPKFQEMYAQVNAPLPYLTKVVLAISDLIIHHSVLLSLGFIALTTLLFRIRHIPKIKNMYDLIALRIPIVGELIIYKFVISKFCRTLGVLLAGGVGISTALSITAEVVNHHPFTKSIEKMRQRIIAGSTISTQLRNFPIFPTFVAKMVSVGERTGKIAEMLQKTADYFDDELDNTIRRLTILIEPALIIVIGGFISIIIVALYLPIFNVAALVQ